MTKISKDFWDEFILWAQVVKHSNPEATIYDVFMRIREELGRQPFSENFLKIIDHDVETELIREAKNLARSKSLI